MPEDPARSERERMFASDSLAAELGIEVTGAPESLAPPVERERLKALMRKQLSEPEAHEVCHLIASFASWRAAWIEVHRAEEQAH